ncbi:MAG: Lin0512 family protein [Pseudomonadota bacterium]
MKRLILETGMGTDLYGQDATKAALRGVNDAIRHSSLTVFTELGLDHMAMDVRVTVGVPNPETLDTNRVAQELPRGRATVTAVKGGQHIPGSDGGPGAIVATVGIEAFYPIDASEWTLSKR